MRVQRCLFVDVRVYLGSKWLTASTPIFSQKITCLVANISNALQFSLSVTKYKLLIRLRTVFSMSTILRKPETLPFSLRQFQDIDFNINAENIQMCLHHELD